MAVFSDCRSLVVTKQPFPKPTPESVAVDVVSAPPVVVVAAAGPAREDQVGGRPASSAAAQGASDAGDDVASAADPDDLWVFYFEPELRRILDQRSGLPDHQEDRFRWLIGGFPSPGRGQRFQGRQTGQSSSPSF